ncbi:MAG: sigma-70 family RNA polymerase sigma factor [Deltaproteobacteria bacterium]|nr:sigma-70 family RNA polymerase sigma factor [Deltaproteobacteria bacterium]
MKLDWKVPLIPFLIAALLHCPRTVARITGECNDVLEGIANHVTQTPEKKYEKLDDRIVTELMARSRNGDTNAKDELVEMLTPHITRIIWQELGPRGVRPHREDIEEMMQNVLVDIVSHNYPYDMHKEGASAAGTWLYWRVRQQCTSLLRNRHPLKTNREWGDRVGWHPASQESPTEDAQQNELNSIVNTPVEPVIGPSGTPSRLSHFEQKLSIDPTVHAAIKKLPPEHKRILELRLYQRLSLDDIAALTGLNNRKRAKQKLDAAMKTLERRLLEAGHPLMSHPNRSKPIELTQRQTQIFEWLLVQRHSIGEAAGHFETSTDTIKNQKALVLDKIRFAAGDPLLSYDDLTFKKAEDGTEDILISLPNSEHAIRIKPAYRVSLSGASTPIVRTKIINPSSHQTSVIKMLFVDHVSKDKAAQALGILPKHIEQHRARVIENFRNILDDPWLTLNALDFKLAQDGSGDILISQKNSVRPAIRVVAPKTAYDARDAVTITVPPITLTQMQMDIIEQKHLAGRSWSQAAVVMGANGPSIQASFNHTVPKYVGKALGDDRIGADDLQFLRVIQPNGDSTIEVHARGHRTPLQLSTQKQMVLSETEAELLALRYLDGLAFSDLANQLKITEKSAKTSLNYTILPRLREVTGLDSEKLGPKNVQIPEPSRDGKLLIYVYPQGRTTSPLIISARIVGTSANTSQKENTFKNAAASSTR